MPPTFVIVGVVIFIGLYIIAKLVQKKAFCPNCGKGTVRTFSSSLPGRCDKCDEYALIVDGQPKRIEDGFVARIPTFEVRFCDLEHPAGWADPWPGRCCVCGAPATRSVTFESHVLLSFSRFLGTTSSTSNVYKLELGCCEKCEKPFDSELLNPPALKEAHPDTPMMFRSYDFWRAFLARNGKRSKRKIA
jgi:ribosomal protein S27AE